MIEQKGSDPAFPIFNGDAEINYPGITIRDYFAGQALAGYLVSLDNFGDIQFSIAAERSYRFADAMLKASKEKREEEK